MLKDYSVLVNPFIGTGGHGAYLSPCVDAIQDFEAIIDLQKIKQVNHLGIHVLQDVSPWIVYPKQVIFYSSEDEKTFTEVKRVEKYDRTKNGSSTGAGIGRRCQHSNKVYKSKSDHWR